MVQNVGAVRSPWGGKAYTHVSMDQQKLSTGQVQHDHTRFGLVTLSGVEGRQTFVNQKLLFFINTLIIFL